MLNLIETIKEFYADDANKSRREFLEAMTLIGGSVFIGAIAANAETENRDTQTLNDLKSQRQKDLDALLKKVADTSKIDSKGVSMVYSHTPKEFLDSLVEKRSIQEYTIKQPGLTFDVLADVMRYYNIYGFVDAIIPNLDNIGLKDHQYIHAFPGFFDKKEDDKFAIISTGFLYANGLHNGYDNGAINGANKYTHNDFITLSASHQTREMLKELGLFDRLSEDVKTQIESYILQKAVSLAAKYLSANNGWSNTLNDAFNKLIKEVGNDNIEGIITRFNKDHPNLVPVLEFNILITPDQKDILPGVPDIKEDIYPQRNAYLPDKLIVPV